MHDQPVRSGSTRHSSPKRHGSILHHHFWRTIEAVEKHSTKGHFKTDRDVGDNNQISHFSVLKSQAIVGWWRWCYFDKCTAKNVDFIGAKMGPLVTLPSTQEGRALVVPATCPGKQEHLTVWERSSILFLLQQRRAATTSHVPVLSCSGPEGHK